MIRLSRVFSSRIAIFLPLFFGVTHLAAQTPAPPATPSQIHVKIVVTLEDSPCPNSEVVIKPMSPAEGWPEGKSRIVLTTDAKGHASVQLGPGKYRAIAHDPGNTKLPADGWFLIKPGQRLPEKIHLNLLYWDCSKITCML